MGEDVGSTGRARQGAGGDGAPGRRSGNGWADPRRAAGAVLSRPGRGARGAGLGKASSLKREGHMDGRSAVDPGRPEPATRPQLEERLFADGLSEGPERVSP